jgi:hypothetical protein
MKHPGYILIGALFFLTAGLGPTVLFAADDDEPDSVEPPVVGRPANFSGAVGSFKVETRAAPRSLQAEDPLIFTIRITGTEPLQKLRRPDLRQVPGFARNFAVENAGDRYLPGEQAREFDYRLRPKNAGVKEIPPFPFVSYKPGSIPDYMGYETHVARAIPLTVQPRAAVQPESVQGGSAAPGAPESVYQVATGAEVLRTESALVLPGPLVLAGLLLVPPGLGVAWYLVWQRRNPDAARKARQRHSQAAQHALKRLAGLGRQPADGQAQRTAEVLAGYLRERLDFTAAVPTPPEIATHLGRVGISHPLGQEVAAFFRACDAAEFAPGLTARPDDWIPTATRLLNALEAESWTSQPA